MQLHFEPILLLQRAASPVNCCDDPNAWLWLLNVFRIALLPSTDNYTQTATLRPFLAQLKAPTHQLPKPEVDQSSSTQPSTSLRILKIPEMHGFLSGGNGGCFWARRAGARCRGMPLRGVLENAFGKGVVVEGSRRELMSWLILYWHKVYSWRDIGVPFEQGMMMARAHGRILLLVAAKGTWNRIQKGAYV